MILLLLPVPALGGPWVGGDPAGHQGHVAMSLAQEDSIDRKV